MRKWRVTRKGSFDFSHWIVDAPSEAEAIRYVLASGVFEPRPQDWQADPCKSDGTIEA